MGRILFFVVLGVGLYVAFRIWSGSRQRGAAEQSPPPTAVGEAMVRCQRCGLNIPKSEALADGERWYCSEGHRRLERESR
jgi:uncharacterized protein